MISNYDYYVNVTPTFIERFSKKHYFELHQPIPETYPVMILDDINIHWFHELNINTILDKWYRRLERSNGKERI